MHARSNNALCIKDITQPMCYCIALYTQALKLYRSTEPRGGKKTWWGRGKKKTYLSRLFQHIKSLFRDIAVFST